jgi:hypothetical protein
MTVIVLNAFTNPALKLLRGDLTYSNELATQNTTLLLDGLPVVPIPAHLLCSWRDFLDRASRHMRGNPEDSLWGMKGNRGDSSLVANAASLPSARGSGGGALVFPKEGLCYRCGDSGHMARLCKATKCLCCGATIASHANGILHPQRHSIRDCTPAGAFIPPHNGPRTGGQGHGNGVFNPPGGDRDRRGPDDGAFGKKHERDGDTGSNQQSSKQSKYGPCVFSAHGSTFQRGTSSDGC